MRIFVYPGSFDPLTNGHLDIISRAANMCDKLIVGVLVNNNKQCIFSMEERVILIEKCIKGMKNVEVRSFSGLLVDFIKNNNITAIIKGLRVVSDFEYELQMALLNKNLDPDIETLFMMTNINYSFLSSSMVRELAKLGGSIYGLVPDLIKDDIINKFKINN